MPRVIAAGAGDAIGVDHLADALDAARFDARDEDSLAELGPLLARLGRNPRFLGDLVIAELERRCAGQAAENVYGAQVFMLKPPNGRYLLRANFWPARSDAVVRASGTTPFFYDLPHDHNFPFLAYGYEGPGYWSDYYEYDVAAVTGVPGEPAGLRFVERSRLEPGRLMLYRARRDVHVQLPPDSFRCRSTSCSTMWRSRGWSSSSSTLRRARSPPGSPLRRVRGWLPWPRSLAARQGRRWRGSSPRGIRYRVCV
jgi:hypothetical protein